MSKTSGDSSNELISSLVERLQTAMKIDFSRFFYDNFGTYRGVHERLEERVTGKRSREEFEENNVENDNYKDYKDYTPEMTRKRSRVQQKADENQANEAWIQLETVTRSAEAVIKAVHRLQFHYRRSAETAHIRKIQSWFRYWRQFVCVNGTEDNEDFSPGMRSKKGLLRRGGIPIVCTITQDVIPVKNSFKLIGPHGQVYAYTCSDLIRYLRSTHKFECPATRNHISLPEVRRLQRRANKLCVNSGKDLVAEYNNRDDDHSESVENGYALTGLESSCTEVFDTAVRLCEQPLGSDGQEGLLMRLEADILPEWRDYARTLLHMDPEACFAMLRNEESRILLLMRTEADRSGFMSYLLQQVNDYLFACRTAFVPREEQHQQPAAFPRRASPPPSASGRQRPSRASLVQFPSRETQRRHQQRRRQREAAAT